MSESTLPVFRVNATWEPATKLWAMAIHDLPRNCAGATQGETLADGLSMAREAISLLLDLPEDAFELKVERVSGTPT